MIIGSMYMWMYLSLVLESSLLHNISASVFTGCCDWLFMIYYTNIQPGISFRTSRNQFLSNFLNRPCQSSRKCLCVIFLANFHIWKVFSIHKADWFHVCLEWARADPWGIFLCVEFLNVSTARQLVVRMCASFAGPSSRWFRNKIPTYSSTF